MDKPIVALDANLELDRSPLAALDGADLDRFLVGPGADRRLLLGCCLEELEASAHRLANHFFLDSQGEYLEPSINVVDSCDNDFCYGHQLVRIFPWSRAAGVHDT